MNKFYENDKSGKKKKFSYMIINHPIITNEILNWAKINNLYGLPFDELTYLKYLNLTEVPNDHNGFKVFKSWTKGYSINGKYKNIEDKFIPNNINDYKLKLSDNEIKKQFDGGFITQQILNNYIFYFELLKRYDNKIPLRQMVYMFLNNINKIPKCKICLKRLKQD
jgi:hypothetical protein